MTSVANQPSRRFGADAPPLPFAPTLGTRSPAAFTPSPNHALNRLPAPFARSTAATSHASPRYRGLEHTLGPTFSEEEDGDDSAFIASKMAVLGLDPNGVPYRGDFASSSPSNSGTSSALAHAATLSQIQRQYQHQYQFQQQQQAIFVQNLLLGNCGTHSPTQQQGMLGSPQAANNPHLRSHLAAQAHAQRALRAAQQQPGYVAQQAFAVDPRHPSYSGSSPGHRSAFAAQVQANAHARSARARVMSPDSAEIRAAFENTPASFDAFKTPTMPSEPAFEASTPSVNDLWRASPLNSVNTSGGRFGRQPVISSLTPTLPRDQTHLDVRSPDEPGLAVRTAGDERREAMQGLGHGRPSNYNVNGRAWTTPTSVASRLPHETVARAASYAGNAIIRQPVGPPGGAKELDEKNFQTRQAGLKLGVLTRRIESPAATTPVLA